MNYRLGIDVGGTNTDAVVLDRKDTVIAKCKRPTSGDISTGIKQAVDRVLEEGGIDPAGITHAMLGTTHSTNAIVERRGLARVGIIRLCAPSGLGVPPYIDWPEDILPHIGKLYRMVKGGYEYNGALISQPDRDEIRKALAELQAEKIDALAVSCVFSPVNGEHEIMVQELGEEILGRDFPISLSSEIGSIGLLERENATILNAAILHIASSAYSSFQNVLKDHGIHTDLFITQNDGTLMSVDYACKYPVSYTHLTLPTSDLV